MGTNKMREQFEQWECDAPQGPQTDPMWLIYDAGSNTYGLDKIQDRWEVWQASRETVVVELPKPHYEFEGDEAPEMFASQVVAAIKAQGLKVAP
ncbi:MULTISPECIES: hypothetical protein [Pseudomonas]|uniref:hypothetical protein n=1 Tax=Pseudomonas TaxID=286 RepID=UPI0007620407|nr:MULTISPECIES: hypothetical protein [Pseudomonas]KYC26120.1 hypothetical protein WM94_04630 [Pseudomonas sp. ABFPK]MCA4076427.1 hypothetical protein [Pseudomonas kurunegalensis]MDN5518532.1 hypothetical protein [Pseudomonas sp.]MDN5532533.1 hypothetical protein [Pseudomonas sp.]MDT3749568.1 hypothetical protein [Pseudomonas kurunegalensis]